MSFIIKIQEAIIVEGTYDKIKLQQIVDTTIIATNGFSIFSDQDRMKLIRTLAEKNGVVVLTDSDKGGFLIRNYLKECIHPEYIKHAYIPEIAGKEKRKASPGKEGLLGVEGMNEQIIIEALIRAGCIVNGESTAVERKITKSDLYLDGFHGKPYSRELRDRLKKELNLPHRISTNSLLDVLNTLYGYDRYKKLIQEWNHKE